MNAVTLVDCPQYPFFTAYEDEKMAKEKAKEILDLMKLRLQNNYPDLHVVEYGNGSGHVAEIRSGAFYDESKQLAIIRVQWAAVHPKENSSFYGTGRD